MKFSRYVDDRKNCFSASPFQLNPSATLNQWLANTKPGECLTATIPNEDALDQSTINQICNPVKLNSNSEEDEASPKWTFTHHKPVASSISSRSINVLDLLKSFSHEASIESVELISLASGIQVDSEGVKTHIQFALRKHLKPLPHIPTPTRKDLIARVLRLYAAKEYESVLEIVDAYSWITSQSADILNAAGASAFSLKCPERAIEFYRLAIVKMPGHYDAWNNLGITLMDVGKIEEAEEAHRKAIQLNPTQVGFKGDLVKLLIRKHQFGEAQSICHAELSTNPKALFFMGELGNIYTRQGKYAQAREQYDTILKLQPDSEHIALNCGVRLFQAGYHKESEAIYRDAITLYQSEMARFHLSLLLLTKGRLKEGWPEYEARAVVRKTALPEYQFPFWKGESLMGKSIMMSFEQGYGDEVMICRYVAKLKAAGATRVGVVCRRPMVSLLKTIDEAEILTPETGEAVLSLRGDEFDYWTLPFDIPQYLGTELNSIPATMPYLKSLPERRDKWAKLLPKPVNQNIDPRSKLASMSKPFTVGIVWKGSALHVADAERSLSHLKQLAPLWSVPGVRFISLQKGQGEEVAKSPPSDQPLIDLGTSMDDFADLAAIVDQLDLVISVDTAVVHVAGALNKPCWVMLPHFATDWRWMLEREDSPWYPSLRLFRQDPSGNWTKTIENLQEALQAKVNQKANEMSKQSISA